MAAVNVRPLGDRVLVQPLAKRLTLDGALLPEQAEQGTPDVHGPVEIAPGAVGAGLSGLGPGLLHDHGAGCRLRLPDRLAHRWT